jgi:hypothetical protein
MKNSLKNLLFTIPFLITLFSCGNINKIAFASNTSTRDSISSRVLKYFSPSYDLSIAYNTYGGSLRIQIPYKVFAMKGKKYYKIDCSVDYSTNIISITKSRTCTKSEGKALMKALNQNHLFSTEPGDSLAPCESFDSVVNKTMTYHIPDGKSCSFQIFNKKAFRKISYNAVQEYYDHCPTAERKYILNLIDIFENKW